VSAEAEAVIEPHNLAALAAAVDRLAARAQVPQKSPATGKRALLPAKEPCYRQKIPAETPC